MRVPLEGIINFEKPSLDKLNAILRTIQIAVNTIEFGNTTISENIWCDFQIVTTPSAGGNFSVSHRLKRIPVGVIPIKCTDFALFKTVAGSAHDSSKVYLNSNVTGASATLLII
jgi:hypothetical protein